MHIAIIAPGSRGDVEPYLALAQGLGRAGHTARLVTHQDFEGYVTAHGVEFWPVGAGVQTVAQSEEMRALLERGKFLAIMALMGKEAERAALAFAQDGLAACRGVDLIVGGFGGIFTGVALAEKLRIPLLQAYYIPFTPTRAYPSSLLPQTPPWFGGALNALSDSLARQVMWQNLRAADRRARREVLDLPPAPFWGPCGGACLRDTPLLYAYSPAVIPPPPDWGADTHVTGYWFLAQAEDWTPPPALLRFLEAGPLPVYVGFGSMSVSDPQQTAALILRALALAGQRGILLSGWAGLGQAELPDSVFALDAAPFGWLFPRVAAVVHHGGAGTTSAGLRAGVPSVIVPFFGDQPYWGQRVAALGVGPAPIPRKRLTAERLAQAIQQAVADQTRRARAAALGAQIRGEDGVACAVEIIEDFILRKELKR